MVMVIREYFRIKKVRSSLVAQRVKDPGLSVLWLRSLLWPGFAPWLQNFRIQKKKKKKERKKERKKEKEKKKEFRTLYFGMVKGCEEKRNQDDP